MIPFLPPALIQAPDTTDFQSQCATYSKAKDWKGLEAFARAYTEAHPKDAPSRAALGYALFAQNRTEEGRTACETAIKSDPRLVQAYIYLGGSYAAEGKRSGVLDTGKRLEKAMPAGVIEYYRMKDIFCAAGADPSIHCEVPQQTTVTYPQMKPESMEEVSRRSIRGYVVLDLLVGTDGSPREVTVLAGTGLLAKGLTEWMRLCRFQPLVQGPGSISYRLLITCDYSRSPAHSMIGL